MALKTMAQNCRGIVSYQPLENGSLDLRLEDLSIRDIEEDDCLVEIVATGLCHTDLGVASRTDSVFPRVLGHEGKLASPWARQNSPGKMHWVTIGAQVPDICGR